MKIKNNYNKNHFIIKSPKLNCANVENILLLLHLTNELPIIELLFEIKRKLTLTSYKTIKKYLVYMADYELISYNGQRHVYNIIENGFDLLDFINKEKERSLTADNDDLLITIERVV